MLFAIDQQQYLQGYLPVVFAMLYESNLNTVGNGAPGADRPGHHQQGERGPRRGARRKAEPARRAIARGRATSPSLAGTRSRIDGQTTATTVPPDERLASVGPLSRLLTRPDIGALIGADRGVPGFSYFARSVDWIGDAAITAIWTDQAAQFGIVAVPVALLMIGGEFDLSAGAMIGSSGLLLGYLATFQDVNIWSRWRSCSRSGSRSAS